ncbi:ABC transporter ATPase component [Lactobacillus kullabergensis]|uniref:ABC transporter ATP-binding protein n=1 Tax=Lactobacillus kullabergensis TaxID=1218493 RepID=A0A0F4LDI9_9LACO|nr:ABC transporter ATP-binding protein [Lactobacillus kullabergensis]AWM75104.1 ABC transporter ATP-binding protein [Lactobacillus kullabergensis]KJY56388.1 ABC transporter ATPase component [Lactobacillus kullabergensis]
MNNILQVKHLIETYKDKNQKFQALDDVSFTIDQGEILALLGPNGAGKTTTVSIIGGYLLPTSGQVILNGQDITTARKRPNIGVSFGGDLGFYRNATAKQNLQFFADLAKVPFRKQKKEIQRVLSIVELDNVANKKVGKFSKGMTQRLHIARSLLNSPSLLLLDEPTSGLDVEIAQSVQKTIKKLADSGISILLTSHTMSEVEKLAKNVVILGAGKVFFTGTVSAVLGLAAKEINQKPKNLEEAYLAIAPKLRRN